MSRSPLRRPLVGGIVLALAASSLVGCAWFRQPPAYLASTQAPPLQLPAGLLAPGSVSALVVPATAAGRVAPGEAPPDLAGLLPAAPAADAQAASFLLDDSRENAFRRVGLALERIDGVGLRNPVVALNAFEVEYAGERFLLRLSAEEGAIRVDAMSPEGLLLDSAAARKLLAALRERLG